MIVEAICALARLVRLECKWLRENTNYDALSVCQLSVAKNTSSVNSPGLFYNSLSFFLNTIRLLFSTEDQVLGKKVMRSLIDKVPVK